MNCKINVFGQIELFRIVDKFSFESEKFSQVLFKLQTVSHKSHATDKKLANKFQILQISKRSNIYKSYFSRVRHKFCRFFPRVSVISFCHPSNTSNCCALRSILCNLDQRCIVHASWIVAELFGSGYPALGTR